MDFEPVDGFPAVTARSRQFRPDESDNKLIATFTEYRGDDEPPASLGNPGDVYIDKTQFILYACYDFSTAEQRWFPWCTTKIEGTHILEHPVHRDSILWAAADVSWVRKRRLENRYRKTRVLKTPKELVKELFHTKTKLTSVKKPTRFIDDDDTPLPPTAPPSLGSTSTSISQPPSRILPPGSAPTKKVPISQRSNFSVPLPVHVAEPERLEPPIGVNFIGGGKDAEQSRMLYEENEALKRRLREMEEENARLRGSQSQSQANVTSTSTELPPILADLTDRTEENSSKSDVPFPSPPPSARPLSSSKSVSRSVSVLAAVAANSYCSPATPGPEPGPGPPQTQTQTRTAVKTGTATKTKTKTRPQPTSTATSRADGCDKTGKTLNRKHPPSSSSKPRVLSSPSPSPSPPPSQQRQQQSQSGPELDRIFTPSSPPPTRMSSPSTPEAYVSPPPPPPLVHESEPESERVQKRKRPMNDDSEEKRRVPVEGKKRRPGIVSPIDHKRKVDESKSSTSLSSTTTKTSPTSDSICPGQTEVDDTARFSGMRSGSPRRRRKRRRRDVASLSGSGSFGSGSAPPLLKNVVVPTFTTSTLTLTSTSQTSQRDVEEKVKKIKKGPECVSSTSMSMPMSIGRSASRPSDCEVVVDGKRVIDLTVDSDSDLEEGGGDTGVGSLSGVCGGSVQTKAMPRLTLRTEEREGGKGSFGGEVIVIEDSDEDDDPDEIQELPAPLVVSGSMGNGKAESQEQDEVIGRTDGEEGGEGGGGGGGITPLFYPSGTSRDPSMRDGDLGGEEMDLDLDGGVGDVCPPGEVVESGMDVDGDGDGDGEVKSEATRFPLEFCPPEEKRELLIRLMYYESKGKGRKVRCLVCFNTNSGGKLRDWKGECVFAKLQHYERDHGRWFSVLANESEEVLRKRIGVQEREAGAGVGVAK